MNTQAKFNFTLGSGETQAAGYNVWGADLGIPRTKPELFLHQIIDLGEM